jgi:hypothetical protein
VHAPAYAYHGHVIGPEFPGWFSNRREYSGLSLLPARRTRGVEATSLLGCKYTPNTDSASSPARPIIILRIFLSDVKRLLRRALWHATTTSDNDPASPQ